MTGERVEVPIDLIVESIKTGDLDPKDMQKSVASMVSDISKEMNGIFKNVDTSKFNKALTSSYSKVVKDYDKIAGKQLKLDTAMEKAGKSAESYKAKLSEVKTEMKEAQASWNAFNSTMGESYRSAKQRQAAGTATIRNENTIKMYEAERQKFETTMASLNAQMPNPMDFVSEGTDASIKAVIAAFRDFQTAARTSKTDIENFNKSMEDNKYTDEYAAKLKELANAQKQIDKHNAKANKMTELGATDKQWKNWQYEADQLEKKVNAITTDLVKMNQEGNSFRFGGDSSAEIDRVTNASEEMVNSMRTAGMAGGQSGNAMSKAFAAVRRACEGVRKGVASLIGWFKKLAKQGHKTTTDMQKSFKKLWKNILMFGLGFRSMYYFVKKLRSITFEVLGEMAKQIPEVNTQLSAFKTAVNQMKGSLGTAFQPILTIVIPILNKLIGALTSAMNAIGRFFATLTGQGYIYKYTAAQVDYAKSLDSTSESAEKAKKSLMGFDEINRLDDNSDSSSGDVAEGTWEQTTTDAFSKLAQLIKEGWAKTDFTDVGIYLGVKLKKALEEATDYIEGPARQMGEKIATCIATAINGFVSVPGLAKSIGEFVGASINTAMHILDTFLVTTKWLDIGEFIADTLNSFLHKTNFGLIGKTLGDQVMAAIDTAWALITNFEFQTMGKKAASLVNHFLEAIGSVDATGLSGWQKLGQSISGLVTGILEALITALNKVEWDEVGIAIGEFLSSIEWGRIMLDFAKLAWAIVKGIATAIINYHKTAPITAAITDLIGVALLAVNITGKVAKLALQFLPLISQTETFKNVAEGAIQGLGNLATTVVNGIKGCSAQLFGIGTVLVGLGTAVSGFVGMWNEGFSAAKEAVMLVGIAIAAVGAILLGAPATVVAVVAGIVAAVATGAVLVKEHWNEIVEAWRTGWDEFKTSWATHKQAFTDEWNTFCENVKTKWNDVKTNLTEAWRTSWEEFRTSLAEHGNAFRDEWDKMTDHLASAWEKISTTITTKFNAIQEKMRTTLSTIKENWSERWTNMKEKFSTIWSDIKSKATEGTNTLKTKISSAINSIKSTWSSVWTSIGNKFSKIWQGITSTVKKEINSIIGFINSLVQKVVNGVNSVISAINKMSTLGGTVSGLNISTITAPKISKLAKGGVIPPNNEFLAVLGDQKSGTNIEAPLETIQEAVANVMDEQLDALAAMAEAIVSAINNKDMTVSIGDRAIGQAASRYNKRQNLVKGVTG